MAHPLTEKKITYIAGRPLKFGTKVVQPGEEVEVVDKDGKQIFPRLDSLISSGRLYPVYNGKDYTKLPSWLYTTVMRRKEAEAKISGDQGITTKRHNEAREAYDQDPVVRVANSEAVLRREGPGAHEKAQEIRLGPEARLRARAENQSKKAEPKQAPKPKQTESKQTPKKAESKDKK